MEPLRLLLQELSLLINQNVEDNFLLYNRNEIINDWLGFEPAIDFIIKEKEDELQTKLPTSYINFLKISNGFRQVSNFTGKLYPIQKINWTKKLHPDLLEAYADHEEFDSKINDEILKDYSDKNNSIWRYSDFTKTITISDWGDGTLLMLNPNSINKRDYEVWELGNWFPGAIRYKNFYHFIEAKIASTKALFEV